MFLNQSLMAWHSTYMNSPTGGLFSAFSQWNQRSSVPVGCEWIWYTQVTHSSELASRRQGAEEGVFCELLAFFGGVLHPGLAYIYWFYKQIYIEPPNTDHCLASSEKRPPTFWGFDAFPKTSENAKPTPPLFRTGKAKPQNLHSKHNLFFPL